MAKKNQEQSTETIPVSSYRLKRQIGKKPLRKQGLFVTMVDRERRYDRDKKCGGVSWEYILIRDMKTSER